MTIEFFEWVRPYLKDKFILKHISRFGVFSYAKEYEILYVADNKEELENICKENNWALKSNCGWTNYVIEEIK